MKKIPAKYKQIFNEIPLVRSVCLRNHIADVDIVLAIMMMNVSDKRYTVDNAIYDYMHSNFRFNEITPIIADYELAQHCKFDISYADIKAKQNENYFGELCFAHNLKANYIRNNEVV